ncbi:ABC transporter substrate-binding protein [Peptostreptococcus faecalis]|uniref:ABC transporter substrate-binding protein n=1 Tax=Peptostreptococcus faecalis TaxID=2045015 RepID=UPI001FA8860A|nr:ABC transporter substrate-binding protein [Peptostreptococcus faecalis]
MLGLLTFVLVGCNKKGDDFVIGIAQLAEHPALDEARKGFIDGLEEQGINFKEDYNNAQGDPGVASQIVQKQISDDVDLIFTIATPVAQSAQQATLDLEKENRIPVLFSAVTDAVDAKLVNSNENPGENITGTLDAAPIKEQLSLFKEIDSSIKNIGIIYNTSERNSEIQIKQAKSLEKELGIKIIDIGVSSINDVAQTLQSKVKEIDGIYTITDNMIASSISIISDIAIENKIITVGAEEAHVKGGILISNGISYYDLGKQTASMAKKILIDGENPKDIPVEKSKNFIKTYNSNTLDSLGIDKDNNVFKNSKEILTEK